MLNKEIRIRGLEFQSSSMWTDKTVSILEDTLAGANSRTGSSMAGCIEYSNISSIRESLSKYPDLQRLLTASVCLRLTVGSSGLVPVSRMMRYLNSRIQDDRLALQLQYFDSVGSGYLREVDLESFIVQILPALSGLSQLHSDFHQFYVYTAARKFMFFLDPRRRGRILISDIVSSPMLHELLTLRNGAPVLPTWFSAESAMAMYTRYITIDLDGNGMLSKSELLKYPACMLTPLTVQRVFQEYLTYESELDYKGYLDLFLALANKNTEPGIKYMWKLLDVNRTGSVSRTDVDMFVGSVLETLQEAAVAASQPNSLSEYKRSDIVQEIFDMLGVEGENLTVDTFLQSRNGGTAISMLIDAHAFYQYDCREAILLQQSTNGQKMN